MFHIHWRERKEERGEKGKEIINKIARKINRDVPVDWGAIPPPKDDPHFLVADSNRLFNEIGWSPKFNLDNGLDETIAWWTDKFPKGTR